MAAPSLDIGTVIGGYRIVRALGAGTFGEVFAAERDDAQATASGDRALPREVAVKVLARKFADDPEVVSRFVAETRAASRVRHPNIIEVFSFGVHAREQRHYFVMELLVGETVRELLDRRERLPVTEALAIARGIAAGLDAAHAAGVVHRDLKPDNVFLVQAGGGPPVVKLLDFGVAKLAGDDLAHKTRTGVVLGTPRYMAPEQARGRPASHLSDVYALGVILHEMLAGAPPFAGPALDVLLQHVADAPPPVSRAGVSTALDAPILAMLAKRAKDRPPSAGEAVAAVARAAGSAG